MEKQVNFFRELLNNQEIVTLYLKPLGIHLLQYSFLCALDCIKT